MKTVTIKEGDNTETTVWGYKRSYLKTGFTWIGYICTGFILRLVLSWLPKWHLRFEFSECGVGVHTERVLCKDEHQVFWIHYVFRCSNDGSADHTFIGRQSTLKHERTPLSEETDLTNMNKVDKCDEMVFFMHKKLKYIWSSKVESFELLQGLDTKPWSYFHYCAPLNTVEVQRCSALYGWNEIVIKLTPIPVLLIKEGLNPFYVFQVASCILWFIDEYTIFASCIIVMSAISLSVQLYQTRKNQVTLRDTVESQGHMVSVLRADSPKCSKFVPARDLVPGDVLELPRAGGQMLCDALLLPNGGGGSCILNEAMLTGESVPVTKTPLPSTSSSGRTDGDTRLDVVRHSRHVLFCGTRLVQTRQQSLEQPVLAVVLRTGFLTAKGGLVRSILFPPPVDLRFGRDAMKLILVLAGFAAVGFVYTVVIMKQKGISPGRIAVRALDLITIVVPPALPVAMTIGIVFAQARLKACSIFCISPSTINTCGGINVACFDKTGTLTEDGMDLWGVLCSQPNGTLAEPIRDPSQLPATTPAVECMATCHSLTYISGELAGDPLDLKMFGCINWDLKEGNFQHSEDQMESGDTTPSYNQSVPVVVQKPASQKEPAVEIGILRQFPFSSSLQRMSVIAKHAAKTNFTVYVKGSPEVIISLCRRDTVPRDLGHQLLELTREGYRVLALASRPLRISYPRAMRIQRGAAETELRFSGLLVMENRLKPGTASAISQLRAALIRPLMVTGDNLLTALSVARDCGLVEPIGRVVIVDATGPDACIELHYAEDLQGRYRPVEEVRLQAAEEGGAVRVTVLDHREFHLALTGRTWSVIRKEHPHMIHKLVGKGTVFARFSPDQKAQVVQALQQTGAVVAMCGDGANDCGALKAAHAGISLCGGNDTSSGDDTQVAAEASVASPFVSRTSDISCVPTLIREGRCALATSFGTFKFMAGYSFTQFLSVLILYWFTANLSDFQFLYVDLLLITTLSITYGYTRAHDQLSVKRPSIRLLTPAMIASLVLQWLLNCGFQVLCLLYVSWQPWYIMPPPHGDDYLHDTYANVAIFIVSSFQYVILAFVFSKAAPFRAPIYTNKLFLINMVVLLLLTVYLALYPFAWLRNLMKLVIFPSVWVNATLLVFCLANLLVSWLVELAVDSITLQRRLHSLRLSLFPRLAAAAAASSQQQKEPQDEMYHYDNWPAVIRSASVQDMRPEIFTDSTATLTTPMDPVGTDSTANLDSTGHTIKPSLQSRSAHDLRSPKDIAFPGGQSRTTNIEDVLVEDEESDSEKRSATITL